jgi:hypothetical protein
LRFSEPFHVQAAVASRETSIGANNTRSRHTQNGSYPTTSTRRRIGPDTKVFTNIPGKAYEEIEDELALDYERNKAGSALPWDHARHAVHAAWAKVSHDIGPRDPDRGIRSGI